MKNRGVVALAGDVYVPPIPRGWWDWIRPFGYRMREEEAYREFQREHGARIWAEHCAQILAEFEDRLVLWEAQVRHARRAVRRHETLPLRRAARRYVP